MPFLIVRHAESKWNLEPRRYQGRADVGLSEGGRNDALQFFKSANWKNLDYVVSSPAKRCLETFAVTESFGLNNIDIHTDERLWELDVGWLSGKTVEQVKSIDRTHYNLWQRQPESIRVGNGETLLEMANRVWAVFQDLRVKSQQKNILVISHGGPIRTLIFRLSKMSYSNFHNYRVPNLAMYSICLNTESMKESRIEDS